MFFLDASRDTIGINSASPESALAMTGTLTVSGAAIFNTGGTDQDFRIEGETEENLVLVDASEDEVNVVTLSGSDLHVERTLSVSGATSLDSTVSINDVQYTFPGSDGTSSGAVLTTDANGQLS